MREPDLRVRCATPTVTAPADRPSDPIWRGFLLGGVGVICFSLTPVATRAAVVGGLSPWLVGTGRTFGAALLAAALLALTRQAPPARAHLAPLLAMVAGVVLGFPLLMTWALGRVPAAHAGAVLGLLPLATSAFGAVRGRERLPWPFWAAAAAGSVVVVAFAWSQGGGSVQSADLMLLAAVGAAAVGYTEGALLSRALGGWQTISWALVLGAPLTGTAFLSLLIQTVHVRGWTGLTAGTSPGAWIGFGYVALVSQYLGFFPWFRGLALGGVAQVGQLQLFMAPLTLVASALLLHEPIPAATAWTAALLLVTMAAGRWAAAAFRSTVWTRHRPSS